MEERLQKLLSAAGICSRRAAEDYITAGRITVNGQVAGLGDKADPDRDDIRVNGVSLHSGDDRTYLMLHKPAGYVTTLSDERGRETVADLVSDCGVRVWPVGRLDKDSEGLLLLTNDGELTHLLTHPSHEIRKTYEVTVTGYTPDAEKLLGRPIELDGYRIRKPMVKLLRVNSEKAVFHVTIHEGRNRQVRRMCAAAGMEVTRLKRIREGDLVLESLPIGTWRHLTAEELQTLRT